MDSRWALEKIRENGHLAVPQAAALSAGEESSDFSNRFGPYKRMHRLLRGRYHLLFPAIIVALALGGYYGWHKAKPLYRSEGIVQVNNRLPTVMAPSEGLDMFAEFVQSQVMLMSSRGVISLALDDHDFQQAVSHRHDMNVDTFEANLTVEQPPRTQVIDISYTDSDPNVATKAVQALISAFMQVSKNGDVDDDRRVTVLEGKEAQLTQQIESSKKELAHVQSPSLLAIAGLDPTMQSLLTRQEAIQAKVDDYYASGFGENRPEMKSAKASLLALDADIDAYKKDVTAMQAATASAPPSDRRIPLLPGYLGYTETIDDLRAERDKVDQRLDVLTTEASLGAERFQVLTNGDTPDVPYADHRPRIAAMYGIALAMLPLSAFMLLGLINRRFRFSEDAAAAAQAAPLLGVLPELPASGGFTDLPRIAAYCVHNLRIRLSLLPGKKSDRVFMITSATAGEGKTSLTLALSFSFASAGKRVLLIDTDLIGRGLTSRLKCEGKPGLLESLSGAGLSPIQQVMKNVSILPVGNGGGFKNTTALPSDGLADLVEAARSRFDLVLMDTGPVVASLQTPIVAQAADHVIMVISQGLQQSLCQRSVHILRSVGIKVSGVVFNRARAKDYRRWIGGDTYYASSSSSAWNSFDSDQPAEFGPLASPIAEEELASANRH
jgi:Mrp family chromosome partitioning ATPase/capsular polysaccharide biosynthesis protein